MAKSELAGRDIESMVKTVMSTANLDARIAWSVLEGLTKSDLAGPWTQGDTDETWWDRKTFDGRLVAGVWDRDGEVGGRLGRGHWANESPRYGGLGGCEVPFPDAADKTWSFDSLEEAFKGMDAILRERGWALVPGGLR